MSSGAKTPATQKRKVLSRPSIFGPTPILAGENGEAYDELLAQVSSAVKPSDTIEDIWIRDIVDFTWEIFRWRRIKTAILMAEVKFTLAHRLVLRRHKQMKFTGELLPFADSISKPKRPSPQVKLVDKLVERWAAGDTTVIEDIEKLMSLRKVKIDNVIAGVLLDKIADLERIDRLVTIIETRRNAVLHEIDRRRSTFSQRLRGAMHKIEDTEFQTVESNAISLKRAV